MTKEEKITWLREGFDLALEWAEVSEHDGWHLCSPFVDDIVARKKLEEQVVKIQNEQPIVCRYVLEIDSADCYTKETNKCCRPATYISNIGGLCDEHAVKIIDNGGDAVRLESNEAARLRRNLQEALDTAQWALDVVTGNIPAFYNGETLKKQAKIDELRKLTIGLSPVGGVVNKSQRY